MILTVALFATGSITDNVYADVAGPNNPGQLVSATTSYVATPTLSMVTSDDTSCITTANNSGTNANIILDTFGLSIPVGATINSVKVTVHANDGHTNSNWLVQLWNGASLSTQESTDHNNDETCTSSTSLQDNNVDTIFTTSLPTRDQIIASSFGVKLVADQDNNKDMQLNRVSISVDFTPPPADNDNDGFDENVDCNDNDDTIFPGATEIPDDGIDQDCNGFDLITLPDSDSDGVPDNLDQCDNTSPQTVVDETGCPIRDTPRTVAGEQLTINSTTLFISGLSSSAIWLVPMFAGIAGIGAYYFRTYGQN